jgi:hypothetical protein
VISRRRQIIRTLAARWIGERPIPIGGVAKDRRLLRRALRGRSVGRVLVIGSSVAVRQALPDVDVDVVGTSPHALDVTVCSAVGGVHSLPRARWDTVIFSQPGPELPDRLSAVIPACRPYARLIVMSRREMATNVDHGPVVAEKAALEDLFVRRGHTVLLARVRP